MGSKKGLEKEEREGVTYKGYIFLIGSWGLVSVFVVYCFYKIFKKT